MFSQDVRVLGAISVGGALGALTRYEIGLAWPHATGTFPWATMVINTVGCFAIGVLMVIVTELHTVHPLVRPFLGVGILGGFTTFSTYAVDVRGLLVDDEAGLALAYLFGTVALALVAVCAGAIFTRGVAGARVWGVAR